MKKKILVTGGDGRFAKILKENNNNLNFAFVSRKECNILDIKSIQKIFKKIKPNIILHCAGLSRPMRIHEKNISKSIDLNIIGTANVTKVCEKNNIKLVYFSTGYVYEGTKGNYSETDPVKPFNNYGLSKLGGECAVSMYKNSLILRITMTEKPFLYKKAFSNLKTNYMFHEDLVKILPQLITKNKPISNSIVLIVLKLNGCIPILTLIRNSLIRLNKKTDNAVAIAAPSIPYIGIRI